MRYDRDELLARTDLAELADELLGWHSGNGRSARWPSPVPNHPQTGKTPPMSIFVDHRGVERWTCFATGVNGTAIDLVTTVTGRSVGDAITYLAERAHLDRPASERRPPVRRPPPPAKVTGPSDALVEYVEACERLLWQPAGRAIRQRLVEERCLDPDVLRLNRVGADPGRRSLRRTKGLPWRGPAAVFPALDDDRRPVYLQARYLHPPAGRGKYDNPSAEHGRNPRIALLEPADRRATTVLVTEGFPDALSAASLGYRSMAMFGVGLSDEQLARRIAAQRDRLAIVFDPDDAGRTGAQRLVTLLHGAGRSDAAAIELPGNDLNGLMMSRGREALAKHLSLRVALSLPSASCRARGIA